MIHPRARTTVNDDPLAFVATAERMTNERDPEAMDRLFAVDAEWRCVIDGIATQDTGIEAIRERWRSLCRFLADQDVVVTKELVAVDGDTLVSRWHGQATGGSRPTGLEVWRFDDDGRVRDQLLLGFLAPQPEAGPAEAARA